MFTVSSLGLFQDLIIGWNTAYCATKKNDFCQMHIYEFVFRWKTDLLVLWELRVRWMMKGRTRLAIPSWEKPVNKELDRMLLHSASGVALHSLLLLLIRNCFWFGGFSQFGPESFLMNKHPAMPAQQYTTAASTFVGNFWKVPFFLFNTVKVCL